MKIELHEAGQKLPGSYKLSKPKFTQGWETFEFQPVRVERSFIDNFQINIAEI